MGHSLFPSADDVNSSSTSAWCTSKTAEGRRPFFAQTHCTIVVGVTGLSDTHAEHFVGVGFFFLLVQ